MATKRDLVEAHDFNRRRLVTAFLSGAPGGREVEPVRHGRTVVGGVVLAALLVAGAAVTGVLKPAVGDDWRQNGLVIAEGTGSRFLMVDETLYPVANITSARLALEDLKISYVPDDVLADTPKGPSIGIVNAPDFLPARGDLVQDGWIACTNSEGGLRTTVQADVAATASPETLVARSSTDGSFWIVSGGRRYPVPGGGASADILRSLGLDRGVPFSASNAWLSLFATGSPVEPFTVVGAGETAQETVDGLTVVGTPVRANDQGYVLGARGLVPLTEFAYRVYRGSPAGARFTEQQFEANELNGLPTVATARVVPSDWPEAVTRPSTDTQPCAMLQRGSSARATETAVLARTSDADLRAEGTSTDLEVAQGAGAVVYATTRSTGSAGDTTYLIDSLGTRYAIVPRNLSRQTLARLGYDGITPAAVPRAWADLLREGPDLGVELSARRVG